ncbi:MAG: SMC-Scp complex subunit ScpB [Clostridia bacterium]|nr:SMC-Scp complex subunit ScpB [Clostridia bacterium]
MTEEILEITEEIKNDTESQDTPEIEAAVEEMRSIVIEEAIEAILFAAGHPVQYATLARVFDKTPTEIKKIITEYAFKYNNQDIPRGVMFLTYTDSCQLCTKQYYLAEIRDALGIKKSGTLSSSALETLAIVAYNQPVTRLFVDTLRKVDSSYAMNSLIDRGLIECKGRLDVPGRPMLYGTTSDFLRCFGIPDLDSLPKTTEEMMEVFANAKLGSSDEELNEANPEIIDTDGTQLSIDDVADADAENVEIVEEMSAEDDIIADFE